MKHPFADIPWCNECNRPIVTNMHKCPPKVKGY